MRRVGAVQWDLLGCKRALGNVEVGSLESRLHHGLLDTLLRLLLLAGSCRGGGVKSFERVRSWVAVY
jgi:hypothetical protein